MQVAGEKFRGRAGGALLSERGVAPRVAASGRLRAQVAHRGRAGAERAVAPGRLDGPGRTVLGEAARVAMGDRHGGGER